MKVQNMTSAKGNKIANQFIITGYEDVAVETAMGMLNDSQYFEVFQSYGSTIVKKQDGKVELDEATWDYSVTTGKYRNQFLGETKKETQAKIDSGEYILTNLN